jgi:hypothetical protein
MVVRSCTLTRDAEPRVVFAHDGNVALVAAIIIAAVVRVSRKL